MNVSVPVLPPSALLRIETRKMLTRSVSLRDIVRICATMALCAIVFPPSIAVAEPVVSSMAGSGRADVLDGNSTTAAFLMPAAVAVASDGTIYVADSAAHDIRRIRHKSVFPSITSGNTNAAAIMVGEKAAEMIAHDHNVKLAEFVGTRLAEAALT